MKSSLKIIIFYVALIGVILVSTVVLFNNMQTEDLKYSDIIELFHTEQVKSFTIDSSNNLMITKQNNQIATYRLRDYAVFYNDLNDLILEQYEAGIIIDYDMPAPVELPWWISMLPYIIVIILFIVLWFYVLNSASGKGGGKMMNNFGKARAKMGSDEKKKVYFKDVAGADEEKEELKEVVDFLRDPAKFTKLGARIPHGVLLVGPPGTGKTLLAKAVAGEAGVPFFSISGSDFVEMYVGVGASRVRDLFDTAKKHPASIIFIDEIDAVGRHRGAGLGGGHDEREQTLNQLLVEMDGFGGNEGVIVIAATNRPDILDPALLRPGRFDRQVTVNYPDIKGREDILRVHAQGKPFEADVDLSTLAKTTVGFTGADLANLLNEAALLSASKGKSLIGMEELEEATIKVIVGPKKKSKIITEKEKRLTAYHEAGHAIVTKVMKPDSPVHQISIVPSGGAGGYTLALPKEDRSYMSKRDMENEVVTLLGGRVAEQLVLGDISTGASNDIQRATNIARNMVTRYGMSDTLGPIVFGSEHTGDEVFLGRDFSNARNYSEETASKIDGEIKRIIDETYRAAETILKENMDKLHFIASFLFKNEIMDNEQFEAAMTGDPTIEDLEAMADAKKRRSEEENKARAKRDEEERRRREEEERRKNSEMHSDTSGLDAYAKYQRKEDIKEERREVSNTQDDDEDENK
ncbi:MAG: ATP-dependent zinc metalloprotease FtsH [Clostridia bacterium]|nr:ATP-dependent zinc metalloprotease FtsH [Clostridia bacterium]